MTIILLLLSILCRFITGIFLNSLIREAENMSDYAKPSSEAVQGKIQKLLQAERRGAQYSGVCGQVYGKNPDRKDFRRRTGPSVRPADAARGSVCGAGSLRGDHRWENGGRDSSFLSDELSGTVSVFQHFRSCGSGREKRAAEDKPDRFSGKSYGPPAGHSGGIRDAGWWKAGSSKSGQQSGREYQNRGEKSADPETVAAFAFAKEPETGEAERTVQTVAEGKSAAQKRMEEQVFSKTQEKELEELLKEFFA